MVDQLCAWLMSWEGFSQMFLFFSHFGFSFPSQELEWSIGGQLGYADFPDPKKRPKYAKLRVKSSSTLKRHLKNIKTILFSIILFYFMIFEN